MIKTLTIQQKVLGVVLGILLGGFFIGWNVTIAPTLKKLAVVKAQKNEESKKRIVVRNIQDLTEQLKGFGVSLAPSSESTWMVEVLNKMAKDAGVKIVSIKTPDPVKGVNYEKISLGVDIDCSYHQLGSLVSKIESEPKLLKISNLVVTAPVGNSKNKALNISMLISSFRAIAKDTGVVTS